MGSPTGVPPPPKDSLQDRQVLPALAKRCLSSKKAAAAWPCPSPPIPQAVLELPSAPATSKGHQRGVACGAGAAAHRWRQRAGGRSPVNELANLPHLRRGRSQQLALISMAAQQLSWALQGPVAAMRAKALGRRLFGALLFRALPCLTILRYLAVHTVSAASLLSRSCSSAVRVDTACRRGMQYRAGHV